MDPICPIVFSISMSLLMLLLKTDIVNADSIVINIARVTIGCHYLRHDLVDFKCLPASDNNLKRKRANGKEF